MECLGLSKGGSQFLERQASWQARKNKPDDKPKILPDLKALGKDANLLLFPLNAFTSKEDIRPGVIPFK